MLVAGATLSLLAPVAAQASDALNLEEMNNSLLNISNIDNLK